MNMIKKTQYKFIAITLVAIFLVLALIQGILNLSIYAAVVLNAQDRIDQIRDSRGFVFSGGYSSEIFDDRPAMNMPGSFDVAGKVSYMYVRMNNMNENAPPFITTNMSDTYSADNIYYIANHLIESEIDKGFYLDMMYEITRDDLNTVVVLIDLSNELNFLVSLMRISLIIIGSSLLFVFLFSYFLSRWAIRPVKTAIENQQRFISDASHELKTPLTVISANAEVLESEIGESRWLSNIKSQTQVMSDLVFDLLDLAKMDETHEEMVFAEFDLSSVILSKSLEFECTAFESGKTFEQNITENVRYKGNEESIKHLVTILIDNAIKHSDENGMIRVTLNVTGNKRIFQVYNTGNGIKNSEKDKIFNRFYRSDESRSKVTGGYGLGLSIAKAIVDAHKGTISVDGEENKWISFTVVL